MAELATGLLFTSMTCPHCPVAKQTFNEISGERSDVELHSLSLETQKAQHLAKKFGVKSVPTFIFYGPSHEAPMGLVGSQTKDVLNKYIDISIGTRKHEEKKRFSFKSFLSGTSSQS